MFIFHPILIVVFFGKMPILMVYLKANKENYLFYFVGVVLILKYHNLFWKVYIIFFSFIFIQNALHLFFNQI
jgi:hypothetical protein